MQRARPPPLSIPSVPASAPSKPQQALASPAYKPLQTQAATLTCPTLKTQTQSQQVQPKTKHKTRDTQDTFKNCSQPQTMRPFAETTQVCAIVSSVPQEEIRQKLVLKCPDFELCLQRKKQP